MRIDHLAAKAGVEVRWRPFLLGPIFQTLGQAEGLPLRLPPVKFPQTGSRRRESRSWVREREGWRPAFTRAVFSANYAEQKDISKDATLLPILNRLGVESEATLVAANAPENKDAFTIGELFWGNDRLEAALLWAKARPKHSNRHPCARVPQRSVLP
jgi:2-hydroxychromene-2-carboxylate isomerase